MTVYLTKYKCLQDLQPDKSWIGRATIKVSPHVAYICSLIC